MSIINILANFGKYAISDCPFILVLSVIRAPDTISLIKFNFIMIFIMIFVTIIGIFMAILYFRAKRLGFL